MLIFLDTAFWEGLVDGTIANNIFAIGRQNATGIQLLGTGFAAAPNLIATTAHVTGPVDKDLFVVLATTRNLQDYQDTTNTNVSVVAVKIHKYDPIRDIAILAAVDQITMTYPYRLVGSDAASTGTPISTLGYPHADHGRLILTEQKSSVGARVILGSQGIKTKHLVLNVQARPGQSGSPVFAEDGLKLVAMVIGSYAPGGGGGISLGGIDPQTLHQTTHALSAEYITEILK